jgi:hypothetical protein
VRSWSDTFFGHACRLASVVPQPAQSAFPLQGLLQPGRIGDALADFPPCRKTDAEKLAVCGCDEAFIGEPNGQAFAKLSR